MASKMSVSSHPNALDPNSLSFEERLDQIIEAKVVERLEEERKRRFGKDFYYKFQTKENEKALDQLIKFKPTCFRVLNHIMSNMTYGNAFECNQLHEAEALGISRMTFYRCIKYLEEHNFLTVMKNAKSSSSVRTFIINSDLVWKGDIIGKRHCKVKGTIMLYEEDQK